MTKAKKSKKKSSGGLQLLWIFMILAGVVFLPSSMLLVIGMLPSVVAVFVDHSRKKSKALTVAAMNFAGCTPFLLDLWVNGHNFEKSFMIVTDATAITVMYAAAAIGYLIDWSMTGIVANVMYQRGQSRKKAIIKQQEDLVERWGPEVTGRVTVDDYGFAVETPKKSAPGKAQPLD
jgi:hypothetical protein